MPIAPLDQDFVATARQPTLLTLSVDHSRLLGNVDDFATLTQALNNFNIFPHGIVSFKFPRHRSE